MNKAELIEALGERLGGDKKAAARAVEAVVDTITRAVAKGERVAITGFGVFEKQVRPARTVRNPATGERIKKGKTAVAKFRPGANLKAVVAGVKKVEKAPAPAKKAAAKKATTKKAAAPAKKAAAKKSTAPAKKATKKATPAKAASTRATAARGAAKKTTAKKTTAKKATARKR